MGAALCLCVHPIGTHIYFTLTSGHRWEVSKAICSREGKENMSAKREGAEGGEHPSSAGQQAPTAPSCGSQPAPGGQAAAWVPAPLASRAGCRVDALRQPKSPGSHPCPFHRCPRPPPHPRGVSSIHPSFRPSAVRCRSPAAGTMPGGTRVPWHGAELADPGLKQTPWSPVCVPPPR